MKVKTIFMALISMLVIYTRQQDVIWSQIPSVRTGQISSILTLTTSAEPPTDLTATFDEPIATSNFAELKYGISLMSYQSWMTDTFSFNTTVLSLTNSSITVRFQILDNTFFTKAKVHYLVVWRPGGFPNQDIPSSPPLDPSPSAAYNNIDVVYGCYLTASLLYGTGTRSQIVGGLLSTNIYGTNHSSQLVVYSMIAGMRLTNSQGNNNYVKVQTIFNSSYLYYQVTVQNNNFLQYVCLTTVVYDPWVNNYYMKSIIQHNTMSLTYNNTGLASIQYAERFDGISDKMFFGFSLFNLSMADTRYLNVETSNISLISQYYQKNSAMNQVVINMLFFSFRTCFNTSEYFYPFNFTCIESCPSNSIPYPIPPTGSENFRFCNPCHYSCDTCSAGQDSSACSACPSHTTSFRSISGSSCPCDTGYADIGETNCVVCFEAMPGCVSCTSATVCTDCDNISYVLNTTSQRCGCSAGYYMASSYCLSYSGCLTAAMFNNTLACLSCDTSLNYIRITSNYSCVCNEGFFLNSTVPECYDICGDGITAKGHCDDNNTDYGDGCDENCNVQNGYHCETVYSSSGSPGISKCMLITDVTVTYLYSKRILNTNSFIMAVKVSPMKSGLTSTAFNSTTFVSSMPIQNQKITYDPATQTIFLEAEYLQPLQGNTYSLKIHYPNDYTYYADSTVTQITTTGINAKLIIDSSPNINNFLPYLLMFLGILTLVLALVASILGLKLAGLQLMLPVQLIYFSLAAIGPQSSYVSSLTNLKYSNGYSVLVSYDYFRTYSQDKNLVAMTYESQFLLSTNIMLGLFVIVLIWLLVHHLRIKSKEDQIDKLLGERAPENIEKEKNKDVHSDDSEDKEGSPEMDEEKAKLSRKKPINEEQVYAQNQLREEHHYSMKIFTFQVDRVYYISYVVLINQMLFGFIVMSLNMPMDSFYFSQELSVIICNFLTFIFLGNIVFIFYDQTSNKMIAFTCIEQSYAYLHLMFNTIIILLLSYTFQQSFSIYLVTALSAAFLLLVIIKKPYCKDFIDFQNLVAFYMGFMLLASQVLLCILKSTSLSDSLELIIVIVISSLIFAGQVLTVIRIILKVNFKKVFDDLKNPYRDRDDSEKKKLKVKQKNLDLLDKQDVEILPPDSVRNGLFTPKEKMIDWQARNTEEYESARLKDNASNGKLEQQKREAENENEQVSEDKDNKLNELQLLKKRLRNTLRIKRQNQSRKTD